MTKIIGITGGIGSGKSIVANYIKSLGYPVYIADEEAKNILNTERVITLVKNIFGEKVIKDKKIDRDELSKIVFNDPKKLKQLNDIIHPLVKNNFETWLKEHIKFPLVFKEAAILFESGSYIDCDSIITITAPIDIRIQRVIERDKTTRDAVLKRIGNQWTDEKRIEKSDFVVENLSVLTTHKKIDEILNLLNN